MLAHIEVEPEPEEKEDKEGSGSEDEAEDMVEEEPKYRLEVPHIQDYWLALQPGMKDFYDQIILCFNEGLKSI